MSSEMKTLATSQNDPIGSGGSALVMVVQTAHFPNLDHLAFGCWVYPS